MWPADELMAVSCCCCCPLKPWVIWAGSLPGRQQTQSEQWHTKNSTNQSPRTNNVSSALAFGIPLNISPFQNASCDLKEELTLNNLSLTIRIRHMLFGAIFFWHRPSTWNLQKVNKTINKRGYFTFELLHPLVVILKHAASARLCWKLNAIFSAPISACVDVA